MIQSIELFHIEDTMEQYRSSIEETISNKNCLSEDKKNIIAEIIKLNVGGWKYTTSKSTLLAAGQDSFFQRILVRIAKLYSL